jgi:ketosteroid isomerase-like protein
MLEDGFICVDAEGRLLNKTDVLGHLRAADSLEFIQNSMAVRSQGDTAIVTGLYRIRGVERGKPFVRRGRFVDTWLYRGRQWVAIASLSTPDGN